MMVKKFLIVLILFSQIVSGAEVGPVAGACSVTERNLCSESAGQSVIMELSGMTNAHGALYQKSDYEYVLCCRISGEHTCKTANRIIGLSDQINAHAEFPSYACVSKEGIGQTDCGNIKLADCIKEKDCQIGKKNSENYPYGVCFDDLACMTKTAVFGGSGDLCGKEFPLHMISLSSEKNAHIGEFNSYPFKICCKQIVKEPSCGNRICEPNLGEDFYNCPEDCVPVQADLLWLDSNGDEIDEWAIETDADLGEVFYMSYENPSLVEGAELIFTVYELSETTGEETKIEDIPGVYGQLAEFILTSEVLDKTQNDYPIYTYYFSVNGENSNYLYVGDFREFGEIGCDVYATEEECNSDEFLLAPETENTSCGDFFGDGCLYKEIGVCIWDIESGCSPASEYIPCGEEGQENCEEKHCLWLSVTEEGDCTTDDSLTIIYKVDKENSDETCEDKIEQVACPYKTELPFFGKMNFILSLIFVFGIYLFLNFKKLNHKR